MGPPAYLVRDNDRAYGVVFTSRVRAMGIRDRPIFPGSPWQNSYVERLIGTLRRDCLDHVLIFGEAFTRDSLAICWLLQPDAHAPGTEEGRAATTNCSTNRHHRCHACSRRIASSLRADMIFGRDSDRRAVHVSFRDELL